jgi:pimeloyl-ACP methyl ester carboxylesterase
MPRKQKQRRHYPRAVYGPPDRRYLFQQKVDGVAWRSKPSWYIVATEDRTIQPELERFVARRMGATTVELRASHIPMLSQPQGVLDVIRNAAKEAQKSKAA